MGTTLHKDLTGIDLHVTKLHADTHVVAGTDPLVLAESQVTNLPADLSDLVNDLNGKAPTVHVHVKADITDFPTFVAGTGDGDVVGAISATPGNLATFADDTGKSIQDGGTITELGAEVVANKSTNVPTDAASDTKYPSVKAVKDYADGLVAGLLSYRGAYDASSNVFPATGGSGTAGAIMKGDMWAISVAGTLGGVAIQGGDVIIAKVNTPAQTAANWNALNTNISYVPEDQANKENTALDTSTVKYPSNAIVKAAVDAKLGAAAYSEGTWTPALFGCTVVGTAPVVTGSYKVIGKLMWLSIKIAAGAGGNTSVASLAGTSGVSGSAISLATGFFICSICSALVNLGTGWGSSAYILTSTFSAQTSLILISAVLALA